MKYLALITSHRTDDLLSPPLSEVTEEYKTINDALSKTLENLPNNVEDGISIVMGIFRTENPSIPLRMYTLNKNREWEMMAHL